MIGLPATWMTDCAAAATIGLLVVAALSDVARRVIPDGVCVALAVIGVMLRLFAGAAALLWSAGIAVALFTVLVLVHSRGALGGGDVKLATAMCLGLSPAQAYRFLVATVLAGGLLSVAYLALRYARPPPRTTREASLFRRVITVERWRIRRRGSLPYGVAIACGGAWVTLMGAGG